MTNSNKDVAVAQLAIYIILLPLLLYLLLAHGKRGILGYLYLTLFCILQVVSAGIEVAKPTSTTAAIISSVGVSPLLLGLAGIIHEAHQYLSSPASGKSKLGWVFQLVLHLVTIAGIVLIAIGTADLSDDAGTSKYNKDLTHRKVGSIILLLAYMAIVAHASWIFLKYRSSANKLARRLLYSTLPALPVIFARLIYTIVYSFASPNSQTFNDLSPATASIAIRVIFVLLLPLLAVLSLAIGGLLSRQLPRSENIEMMRYSEDYGRNGELQDMTRK